MNVEHRVRPKKHPSNIREDEAIRDLRKALKRYRPKRRHSAPALRSRDDILDPEIGYALKDLAQPGGFRRKFAQGKDKELVPPLVETMENHIPADIIATLASDNDKSARRDRPVAKDNNEIIVKLEPAYLPQFDPSIRKKKLIDIDTLKLLLVDYDSNAGTPCPPSRWGSREKMHNKLVTWTPRQVILLWYILAVSALVNANKTIGASFLPIVLQREFGLSNTGIGFVTAAYPFAAFLSVPLLTIVTQRVSKPFYYHAAALILMALCTFSFSVAHKISVAAMIITRLAVGMSSAFYFSASMFLIVRSYDASSQVPAIVGYIEGAFGVGGMIGRIFGGSLYGIGGFDLPYVVEMGMLIAIAGGGLLFIGEDHRSMCTTLATPLLPRPTGVASSSASIGSILSWPIVYVVAGLSLCMLPSGFFDAFLALRFDEVLGHTSSSTIGLLSSGLPCGYIIGSISCSYIMSKPWCTNMRLLHGGGILLAVGLFMVAPIITTGYPAAFIVVGLFISSIGMAAMLVPSLPAMHERVLTLREKDLCGSLCVGAWSIGDAMGPVALGAIADHLGFRGSTIVIGAMVAAWCTLIYTVKTKERVATKMDFVARPRLVSLDPVYAHLWMVTMQHEQSSWPPRCRSFG